ncbi:hypothetical protein M271_12025 [Streptomyces rapamycinicus NRRL 5491]|uniref:Uncharacterized protein n=1 Tax=Streptomyces rapamycinicus (strain ATCC 29253 / DSM 41530 / NRRL 5491 / AYB-994) TaxID=1343740 RepID=A0A0A0N501_STRRN|nr:hypothetical protein M271_12025 [Streptomyces rapamycinicus NRRL 5491]RLV73861.1 hypothetical protein D3C57_131585 [Streptomyces rapamycinicus NRRL 5491]
MVSGAFIGQGLPPCSFDTLGQCRRIGIDSDHKPQIRGASGDLSYLVELRGRLTDEGHRFAMYKGLLYLGRRVGGIHADYDTADTLNGKRCARPLWARAAHHCYAIAVLDTLSHETECNLAHTIGVRAPRDRLYRSITPVAQRNGIGILARAIEEQSR